MGQISFKIPDEELAFLKWYSEQSSNSISTIYREVTFSTFKQWKLDILCKLYSQGAIGFKQLCKLGNISFQEGLILIEEKNIDPPIPSSVDNYTEKVANKLLQSILNE